MSTVILDGYAIFIAILEGKYTAMNTYRKILQYIFCDVFFPMQGLGRLILKNIYCVATV